MACHPICLQSHFFEGHELLSVLIFGGVVTLIAILIPTLELEDEEEETE